MARCTRSRVAGRTLGEPFTTRETVWWDTPANRATSKMFGARSDLFSVTSVLGFRDGGTRNKSQELVDSDVS